MKTCILLPLLLLLLTACDKSDLCIDPSMIEENGGICTMQYDPVCGCNGETYSNACFATASGVIDYTNGPCD